MANGCKTAISMLLSLAILLNTSIIDMQNTAFAADSQGATLAQWLVEANKLTQGADANAPGSYDATTWASFVTARTNATNAVTDLEKAAALDNLINAWSALKQITATELAVPNSESEGVEVGGVAYTGGDEPTDAGTVLQWNKSYLSQGMPHSVRIKPAGGSTYASLTGAIGLRFYVKAVGAGNSGNRYGVVNVNLYNSSWNSKTGYPDIQTDQWVALTVSFTDSSTFDEFTTGTSVLNGMNIALNPSDSNSLITDSLVVGTIYVLRLASVDLPFTKPDAGSLSTTNPIIGNNEITQVNCLTQDIKSMQMVELELNISGITGNVYDPDNVALDMEATSSTGVELAIPGFYYVPYSWNSDGHLGSQSGQGTWRLRFTPTLSGTWDLVITLKQNGQVTDSVSGYINVRQSSDTRGTLKVEPVRRQNFVFQNGQAYIPIGENIGWSVPVSDNNASATYFNGIIDKIADNGGNFARLWLCSWNLAFIGSQAAPNDLSLGMGNVAMFGKIVQNLAEENVYVSLCIYQSDSFKSGNDNWTGCAYNAANHGYLTNPADFFKNAQAKKDAKIYLRYIVARYGYSSNIMTWELFNEIDGADGSESIKTSWCSEMTQYLRSIDPYEHMVSNSAANYPYSLPLNAIFDFVQFHRYNYGDIKNLAALQKTTWNQLQKPVLIGEAGILMDGVSVLDNDFVNFHQQNWIGVMGGGAGTCVNWFWEQLAPLNGYRDYTPLSRFAAKIPWTDPDLQMVDTANMTLGSSQLQAEGYRNSDYAYLWIWDSQYTHINKQITNFNNVSVSISIENGSYNVEWFDTWTGSVISTSTISVTDGTANITTPAWSKDIAVSITKN